MDCTHLLVYHLFVSFFHKSSPNSFTAVFIWACHLAKYPCESPRRIRLKMQEGE